MEEIDEFSHQAMHTALPHPPTAFEHYLTALLVVGVLVAIRPMLAGPFLKRKPLTS